jgi:sterol desaturase/sphingolipid hydroxylase (fatty acid hydroxylase superfamily)
MDSVRWFLERAIEQVFSAVSSWSNVQGALWKLAGVLTDFESGMAWPFLLVSLTMAWAVFVAASRRGDCPEQRFVHFLFPQEVYFHSSARLDYRFYVINTVLKFFFYVPIMVGMGLIGYKLMSVLLVERWGWEPPRTLSPTAVLAMSFGFFLFHDFVNYVTHVLFHKVPALWAFHQLHHAAEVLTPITAYRVHPMEVLLPALLQAPVIGLASVCFQNLIPSAMALTTLFGVGVFGFLFGLLGHHLQHSHIWLSFGPFFNRLYISPAQHQIHHSSAVRHRDKNFGVKFAIWDLLFGTLYVPAGKETISYGLAEPLEPSFRTVASCYWLPVVRAAKLVRLSVGRRWRVKEWMRQSA